MAITSEFKDGLIAALGWHGPVVSCIDTQIRMSVQGDFQQVEERREATEYDSFLASASSMDALEQFLVNEKSTSNS